MARAFPQSEPADFNRDPGDWQSLRHELVTLLDQVESRVARSRSDSGLGDRVRELRDQVGEAEPDSRHRDALKSVQKQISRFEEPAPPAPVSARDSLEAAINQIRSRQGEPRPPLTAAAPPQKQAPASAPRSSDGPAIEKLAQSVGGLSGRLERLEGEIRAQLKTGASVKDVADQVAQLAHVVELLAGAVGETGQVKRLEGQIASLGKIMSQGREMDISTLTRRLDDVAATVGKLAELQVHYVDRVENPVESQAFKDGMRSIEESVRSVYDRIDSLERNSSLTPRDLEHVTAEMARFTEAMQAGGAAPQGLVELIDALNGRIADIESGDRLLIALRKDLGVLRDALVVSLGSRFDALEHRMDTLGTREDMAEIGRQIGVLNDRMGDRSTEHSIGHLEAQVRQLVARMDQTGEQLSGLAKLYTEPTSVAMPDFDAVADLVAERTAAAVEKTGSGRSFSDTIATLEARIGAMLKAVPQDSAPSGASGIEAGIGEVNDRLKRLEESLTMRNNAAAAEPVPLAPAASLVAEPDRLMPKPRDVMPRSPAEDAPLIVPAFPEPTGAVQQALESKQPQRKRHPGLTEADSLASRHDPLPAAPTPPPGFEPERIPMPAAPRPSIDFHEPEEPESEAAPVPLSSRNTFIEAARRAAQRQQPAKTEIASNSLIGRALARFQLGGESHPKDDAVAAPAKPPRKTHKPEPVEPAAAPLPSIEPQFIAEAGAPKAEEKESFLTRNRKTILLAAAVVAIAFLTLNLVAQRLNQQASTPAPSAAPATTGDIGGSTMLDAVPADALAAPIPPRLIPLADPMSTGAIDPTATQSFSTSPQAMPSAFAPASEMANTAASMLPSVAPLEANVSPVKVEMPPEGIGPVELRQAAANGDPRAQFEVAAIFTEGRAVAQDYAAAAVWYERAAAQGFVPAQYRLGSLYESGNGVIKNLDTARLWYERAAEAGNRMSMHNLAALYAGGQLGKQQFDSAAKWFEEASKRGLTDSQFNLGMLYARGLGVPQSLQDSFKWFGIAALSGDKDAAKARDDIARSLDADTVAKLTAEVNGFEPEPVDIAANFAPIGTWMKDFDPGETISAHDIVQSVQKALGKLGYDVGTPDGVAGKKTADAIKSFEQATGMSPVGLINPRLLAVLGSQPV